MHIFSLMTWVAVREEGTFWTYGSETWSFLAPIGKVSSCFTLCCLLELLSSYRSIFMVFSDYLIHCVPRRAPVWVTRAALPGFLTSLAWRVFSTLDRDRAPGLQDLNSQESLGSIPIASALIKVYWINKWPRVFWNNSLVTPTQSTWVRRAPLESPWNLKYKQHCSKCQRFGQIIQFILGLPGILRP